MARLLVIDDDQTLADVLQLALTEAGHNVALAHDGETGLKALVAGSADLALVDVNMPKLDGFSLLKRAKDHGVRIPVIMLTSRDSDVDEALGLELGADDYIAKPFSTRVLLARVNALLRRGTARQQPVAGSAHDGVLRVGELTLHAERMECHYRGIACELTLTEFKLLEALVQRPGVVLSRDRLLDHARGDDSVVGERLIDSYIRRLRRKFETCDAEFRCIETVSGAGYRWRTT